MESGRNSIKAFRDLKLTRDELRARVGGDLFAAEADKEVMVMPRHVIRTLRAYETARMTLGELLDWVNTISFTDLFDYPEKNQESIACVMSVLEELDEPGARPLDAARIARMVAALEENRCYSES